MLKALMNKLDSQTRENPAPAASRWEKKPKREKENFGEPHLLSWCNIRGELKTLGSPSPKAKAIKGCTKVQSLICTLTTRCPDG